MNSTSTLFAFLQKIPSSSELISGICGTRRVKEVTEQAESNWLFGDQKTGMKSIKEVDEYVIHPNTLRSLERGQCVMVQKYPVSKSLILKVRPEIKASLTDQEVRDTLEYLTGQQLRTDRTPAPKIKSLIEKQVDTPKRSVESSSRELGGYWRDDSLSR